MDSRYFSRVYFSRYFYSSFKSTLKTRIKITRIENVYFYSDPYYLNKSLKQLQTQNFSLPTTPARSYFFSTFFKIEPQGSFYDLGWKPFITNSQWRIKFFSFLLKLKFANFVQFGFTKIYFNFFFKSFK